MAEPFSDPALSEQIGELRRQLNRLDQVITEQARMAHDLLTEMEGRVTLLTDAKFVTYRTLIDSQAEKVALALSAADKAVAKAEMATERRFESVNEFRAQLADQVRTFMPRTEASQLADQATERIRDLADQMPKMATRLEVQVMTKDIDEIKTRLTRLESLSQGAAGNRAGIYAALGAATALIVAIVIVANFIVNQ